MFGADSQKIISAADVVLICGTTVLPEVFPSLEGVFGENAKVIQFDLNATEIAKNFPARSPSRRRRSPSSRVLCAKP